MALEPRDHRLRAALRRRDVVGELRDLPRAALEEAGDVPARGEGAARAGEHDEAHGVVGVELGEEPRELVAREHRDAVELPAHVEGDRRDSFASLDPEAVPAAHETFFAEPRSFLTLRISNTS